ncbi:MAG TPA: hypothetical protein DDY37_05580 [Legionella sp.]|nr:hypothetical protein [Legionella sp.]
MQLDHFIALLDTLTESERVDILTSAIPNGEEAVGVRMQRVNLLEGVVDPRLKTWMQQIEDLSLMDNALQQLKNIFKDDASMDHFMLIKSLKMGLFDSPHVLSKAQLKKILLSEEGLLETILSNHQDEKAAIAIRLLAFLTPEDQSLVINRSKLSLFNLAISHPNDMIFAAVVALIKKHPSPEVIINDGKGEASALSAILLTSPNMSTKLERINALLDLVPKEHLLDSFPSDFFIKLSSFRVRGFYQAGHFLNWMSQSTSSPEDIRRKKADLLRAIPHALHEALMNTYTIEREPPGVLLDCLVSTLDMHSQANVFRIYEKSKHRSEYSKEDYRIRKFNADEKRDYYLLELASDVVSLGREHAWLYEKMITLYNQLTRCMSALKNSENAQHHETSNAQRMQAIWTAKKQIRSGSYIHKLLTNLERSMQDDSFSINIREKSFQAQVEDKIKLDRVNEDKKQHENKSKWMDFYAAVQQRDPEFLKHFESSDGMLDTASIMEQGIRMQDINSNTNCNRLTETYVRFYAKFPYIIAQLSDVINTFSLDDQTAIFKQVEHQLSPEKWNDLNRILKEDQTVKDARLMDYFEPLSVDSAPLVAQTGTGPSNVPPQINAINNDAYQALLNFLKNKKEHQQHQQDDNPLVTAAKDDLDRIPVLLAAMKSLPPADQLLLLEDFSGHIRSILRENPLATKSPYLAQLVNDYAVLTNANDLNALREMVTTEHKLHHENWNDFLDLDASRSTMQTQIQALKQKEIPLAIVKDKPLLIKLMALIKTFPRNEISAILKKNQQNLIFQVIHDPEAMAAVQSTMNASDEAGYIRDISLRYALRKTLDNGLSTAESVAAQSLLLTQTKELPEYAQQQILLGCLSQFRRMEHLAPLLAHIKELTYESQFNILKWFGSKHSIRWKTQSVTSQSPQAKRDYHLIELAAKAYAYQQQALQEKGAEKARYESAARYASALHATLNALTADEKNGPCTIVQTEADWLRAIDNAKRQFKEIDKEDNLEIKGLLRRLWGAIKRLTRAVLAPKTLLDELSAARPSHVYASPQVICLKSYPEMEKKFVAENTQGFWPLESAFCYSGAPISPETISQIVTEINQSVRQEDRIKILSHYICTMKNASFLIHTGLSQQMEPLAKKHLYLLELERITLDPKFTQHHQQKKLHSQLLSDLLAYERIKNPTPNELLELDIKWVLAIEKSKIGQSSWSTFFFGRSTKPSCAEAFKATLLTMQQECISPEALNLRTTNKPK